GLAAIDADSGALIDGEGDDVGVFGINPDSVIVVPAGRSLDGREGTARVGGAVGRNVCDVDCVFVSGVDAHAGKIVAAPPDAFVVVDALPAFARIVRAVEAAELGRIDEGVDAVAIGWGDTYSNAAQALSPC